MPQWICSLSLILWNINTQQSKCKRWLRSVSLFSKLMGLFLWWVVRRNLWNDLGVKNRWIQLGLVLVIWFWQKVLLISTQDCKISDMWICCISVNYIVMQIKITREPMKIEAELLASSTFCEGFARSFQLVSAGDVLCILPCYHAIVSQATVVFPVKLKPEGSIIMKRSEKCSCRLGMPAHWCQNIQNY